MEFAELRIRVPRPEKKNPFKVESEEYKDFLPQAAEKMMKEKENLPSWLQLFVSNKPVSFIQGGFKALYKVGDWAISVEIGPKGFVERRKYVLPRVEKALASLPPMLKKVAYAQEFKEVRINKNISALFSKLNLCEDDMFEVTNRHNRHNSKKEFYTKQIHFFEGQILKIAVSLQRLHDGGMYLLDIKPENMLVCHSNIYLADVEDLVFVDDEVIRGTLTEGYGKKIFQTLFDGSFAGIDKGLRLAMVDWLSFSRAAWSITAEGAGLSKTIQPTIKDTIVLGKAILENNPQDIEDHLLDLQQAWKRLTGGYLNYIETRIPIKY